MGLRTLRRRWKLRALDAVARAVKLENLTYLDAKKLANMVSLMADLRANHVAGDIYEFGIALGGSSILLASHMEAGRCFRGYDVFGQIPPPSAADQHDTHARYDTIASGQAKGIGGDEYYGYKTDLYQDVVDAFARHDLTVDGARIALHQGLFEDTLMLRKADKVALVHIDCDWHDPVAFCLRTMAPHLSDGGMMIIDDFNDYEGCRNATNTFLDQHPEFELLYTLPHAVIRRRG